MKSTNTCFLTGVPCTTEFSHEYRETKYFKFDISAYVDNVEQIVNCMISGTYADIVNAAAIQESSISVWGYIKTFTGEDGIKRTFLMVKDISQALPFEDDENFIVLDGMLLAVKCWGTSCNFTIKVTDPFGKNDYIPCTADYANARAIVRARERCLIKIEGYIKSREVKSSGEFVNNVFASNITFLKKGDTDENFESGTEELQRGRDSRNQLQNADVHPWSEQGREVDSLRCSVRHPDWKDGRRKLYG